MKKKICMAILMATTMSVSVPGVAFPVSAAVEQNDTTKAYDAMIKKEQSRDELDLIVKQKTLQDGKAMEGDSETETRVQVSGLTKKDNLKYSMTTNLQDNDVTSTVISTYSDGVLTVSANGQSTKSDTTEETARKSLNNTIYLYLDSEYLTSLTASEGDNNTTVYQFEADVDATSKYMVEQLGSKKEDLDSDSSMTLHGMSGTITADSEGNVLERKVTTTYSIKSEDGTEHNYTVEYDAAYINGLESSKGVNKSNATAKISSSGKSDNGITETSGVVYAISDANVRAAASTNAEIIGGVNTGDQLQMTGKTSDNWIRINYNGSVGFVYGDYISDQKPSSQTTGKFTEASGKVTTGVETNFRTQPSSDSTVIEVIPADTVLELLGQTDTGWLKVSYNGNVGYIAEGCTGWFEYDEDPDSTTYMLEGIVADVSVNYLGVNGLGGAGYYSFNIANAKINPDISFLAPGHYVKVHYQIQDGTYYASAVGDEGMYTEGTDYDESADDTDTDSTADTDDSTDTNDIVDNEDYTISYGCITYLDYPDVTVSTYDGNEYSANLKGIGVSGYLEEGQYVEIYVKDGEIYQIY